MARHLSPPALHFPGSPTTGRSLALAHTTIFDNNLHPLQTRSTTPEKALDQDAIPIQKGIEGWKNVQIHECFEKLVPLSELGCDRVVVAPAYFSAGLQGALSEAYLREGTAQRLADASKLLPAGLRIAILDAWRPLEVQASLFNQIFERNKNLHPNLSDAELVELSEKSAARPSEDAVAPFPHSTGGSLDVTIMDEAGNSIEMGAGFDEFSEPTPTRHFEEKIEFGQKLSATEMLALKNRRLLFHALRSVGFTNYHREWWHFDFGNQLWAVQENTTAIYGKASLS